MDNLNKENFWNNCQALYPGATKEFCDWIDEYKKEVNWESIMPTAKFHDVPIQMQTGIWLEYLIQHGACSLEIEFTEYDLEEDILTFMAHREADIKDDIADEKKHN